MRIVTDSAARFESPTFAADNNIEVVRLQVNLDGQTYADGSEIDSEELFYRMRHTKAVPTITPPSIADWTALFETLNQTADEVCVLTHSRHLSETFFNAREASSTLLGRCEINVIDSRTTSVALGLLVEAAATTAAEGANLSEVIRTVRATVNRLYSIYYVETLDYMQRSGLLGPAQAILGSMLNIMAFLTLEDGELVPMEKVRTPMQAIDKLVEFVTEFNSIEKLVILQNTLRSTEQTRMLQDRLSLDFPKLSAPIMLYEPLLSSYIGPDGMGVVVLEGESEDGFPSIRSRSDRYDA